MCCKVKVNLEINWKYIVNIKWFLDVDVFCCRIKRELENCVVMVVKECENDEVMEYIKIFFNGLFDYMYKI